MDMVDGWEYVKFVHDTFKRDIEQGFWTKDKEFAVSLLGKALEGEIPPSLQTALKRTITDAKRMNLSAVSVVSLQEILDAFDAALKEHEEGKV